MKRLLSILVSMLIIGVLCFNVMAPVAFAVENVINEVNATNNEVNEKENVVENTIKNEEIEEVKEEKVEEKPVTKSVQKEETKEVAPITTVEEKARLVVDTPYAGEQVEDDLVIEGWVMTTVDGTSLQIYVDGKKVDQDITRKKRQDVLDVIKDYGTDKTNPTPGYTMTIKEEELKEGKHSLRVEVLNQEGILMDVQERNFTYQKKQGQARIVVDTPYYGELVESDLEIKGWVMADVAGTVLNTYLDGKKVELTYQRQKRQDVLDAIKGYGTIKTNPTPGYSGSISEEKLTEGKHRLKVEVRNKYGVLLDVQEKEFTYKKKQGQARLVVDNPYYGELVESDLTIKGWVMADVTGTVLNTYLDGKKVEVTYQRQKRQDVLDVIKGYGTIKTNPTPGYIGSIPEEDLTEGSHSLKVEVRNRDGILLDMQERSFTYRKKQGRARLVVDNPYYGELIEGDLAIKGWVMTDVAGTVLNTYLDGKKVEVTYQREKRQDVLDVIKDYGTEKTNPTPGYVGVITESDLKNGTHSLKIEVVNKNGIVLDVQERKFTYKEEDPKARLEVDLPEANTVVEEGNLAIKGWVMTNSVGTVLNTYVDGKKVEVNYQRQARPDVTSVITGYGNAIINALPGFTGNISIAPYKNGTHTLRIETVSKEGILLDVKERSFKVDKPGPKARIAIDLPETTTVVDDGKVFVKGWVMANVENTILNTYVDGKKVEVNYQRELRQDVLDLVTGYGDKTINPFPGFTQEIEVKDLGTGEHVLRIEAVTKEGEVLTVQERKFKVDQTPGTQYETYNSNGWQEVKKNGQTAGNTGKALQAIKINFLGKLPEGSHIEYQVHISNVGWQEWKQDGDMAGIEGKTIEGIRIRLQNAEGYSITYRASVLNQGWQGWAIDGELAGTTGQEKKIETIEIKITKKIGEIGRVAIDTPNVDNKDVSVPKGKVELTGWALTNSKNAEIKVLIDGKEQAVKITRHYRQDVIDLVKGFGGAEVTPLPGYKTYIDFSSYASDTIHTVEVRIVSKTTGKTIAHKTGTVKISKITNGIDVSYHNGLINWNAVKQSQDFVMIRAGFRGYGGGTINMDTQFIKNIQGAQAAGLKIGVYFFTQAITEEEAKEEANWIMDIIKPYNVTYPVVIDTEYSGSTTNGVPDYEGRADNLDKDTRTKVVKAFLDTVKARGTHTPAVYASTSWLNNELDMSKLTGYDVWVAQYNNSVTYTGEYSMWQYTSDGSVDGLSGRVDQNICYKNY